MIIKFVMKILPTCLPSGLTVASPDAFGQIPGVTIFKIDYGGQLLYKYVCSSCAGSCMNSVMAEMLAKLDFSDC